MKFVFIFGRVVAESRASEDSQVREIESMVGEKFFKGGKRG